MNVPRWDAGTLRSPLSNRPLARQGHVLIAGDEIWPVIDEIPFLRAERIDMARTAVELLDRGEVTAATALLLTDQDPYAPDPPPTRSEAERLVQDAASRSFRDAMQALRFGRVADYFAHRWTDPTFLSGLALLDQAMDHVPSRVFELACGAGHFLAALHESGVEAAGADLVFAKLWLARHYVSPSARLVCFDAQAGWPLAGSGALTLFCHDAFYFLPDKPGIAARMRELATASGTIAIGHAHNAEAENHSPGGALTVAGYATLFPGATLFDDRELTRAFVENRAAEPGDTATLHAVPALSLIWRGDTVAPAPRTSRFDERLSRPARLNPLYRRQPDGARIVWPSRRYEEEYGDLVSYPMRWTGPDELDPSDPGASDLLRRRIYVDLPPRW